MKVVEQRHPGDFLKPCPGTGEPYLCCGYKVLNPVQNCSLGCDYCILQSYLKSEEIIVFTNFEAMESQLRDMSRSEPEKIHRVGTGELSDSLLLENRYAISKRLIRSVASLPNVVLELKTKLAQVDSFNGIDHRGHTILAWSLSPQLIIDTFESSTSSLEQRLAAAHKACRMGYHVAFHLDPMIHYDHYEKEYEVLIHHISRLIPQKQISWISMGAFRYTKHLGQMLETDPVKGKLLLNEFVLCKDGKFRYFRKIRSTMFKNVYTLIKTHLPHVFVYLCMESRTVWREAMGYSPQSNEELTALLDEQAKKMLQLPLMNP